MIEQPKRSVTRFFIPLIDVLTLLFCVFLIMPLARPDTEEGAPLPRTGDELMKERFEDKERIRQLQQELAKIQEGKGLSLQERIAFRVLEIDGKTGKLYYRDKAPEPHEIRTEADARSLIENDRRAIGVTRKDLMYVILYPRNRESDHPTTGQRDQYEAWFRDANVRFDKPGDEP
jgi:hypothetical protein